MDAYARAPMMIPTTISDNAGYDSAQLRPSIGRFYCSFYSPHSCLGSFDTRRKFIIYIQGCADKSVQVSNGW